MPAFRTFHHAGRTLELAPFEAAARKASPTARSLRSQAKIIAPGAGAFEIEPIALSSDEIAWGEAVTVSTRISGKNIAFIYVDLALYDQERDRLYGPVYRDYILAGHDKEVGGVRYPDWEDSIYVEIEIEPVLRVLTDGVDSAFGFISPERYGVAAEDAVYWLDGLYTLADGQSTRDARMFFDSAGKMDRVLASGKFGKGAPRALTPQPGDQFTPFAQALVPPQDKTGGWKREKCLTNTLTFRGPSIWWDEENLIPGMYLAGVIVQDLDGNLSRKYAELTITQV
jgi:hypothetical protein